MHVVEGGDAAQGGGRQPLQLVACDQSRLLQLVQHAAHQRLHEPVQPVRAAVLHAVIGRVEQQAAVQEGPAQVLRRVLLRADRAGHYLRIDVVVQLRVQRRLDWEGRVEEAEVEVLLALLHQHDRLALGVELRPARSAHHLQHVGDGKVHVGALASVVELRAFDDDEVGGKVHAPSQRGRADQHLHLLLGVQPLHQLAVSGHEACVVHADAEAEHVAEMRVAH